MPAKWTGYREPECAEYRAKLAVAGFSDLRNSADYPFDLTDLRALDTTLASACLDYLNYDRLGHKEVHKHLENGDEDLLHWLRAYRITPQR